MSDNDRQDDTRPSRADVDDVADASIGVDTRIFRTLWDTLLFPGRVVEAAYAGDRDKYVPIIRLFLVLFGAQFAIMAFADLPTGMSLDALETTEQARANVAIWVEQGPQCRALLDQLSIEASSDDRASVIESCRDSVDLTLERMSSIVTMPLVFLMTLPFLLLLKAYKWKRSLFGHLLAYLAATNSSYVVVFPAFLLIFVDSGGMLFWAGFGFSLLWFFISMGRILHQFYSQNPVVITFQLLGQFALLPIMFFAISLLQLWFTHLAVSAFNDLSIVDLFMMGDTPTIEETNP